MDPLISEYQSEDGTRSSQIVLGEDHVYVILYYDEGALVASRRYPSKTLNWAEDQAENWVLGELTI